MKKPYIRPESRLFAINLAENIAASGGDINDSIHVEGTVIITDGPAGSYYSIYPDAIVTVGPGGNYFADLYAYYWGIPGRPHIPDIDINCTIH